MKAGDTVTDEHGEMRIIVIAEGYAMLRRKGAMPFLRSIKELERAVANAPLRVSLEAVELAAREGEGK